MTFTKYTIKKGQIWESKQSKRQFIILSRKGARWRAAELTHRAEVFASTHSFLPHILRQKFTLL